MSYKNNVALELEVDINISDEYIEMCGYFLLYAKNLRANWLYSQRVFRERLLPLALKNPQKFALMVNDMVNNSGEKIKAKGLFSSAIKEINRYANVKNTKVKKISIAINCLLEAGLKNSVYAKNAILNLAAG